MLEQFLNVTSHNIIHILTSSQAAKQDVTKDEDMKCNQRNRLILYR